MGTAELVVVDGSSLEALALRAFVGGVFVLTVVVLAAHLAHKSNTARRLLLVMCVGVVTVVSSILLTVAWTNQSSVSLRGAADAQRQ